ncbi:hypothetical protein [Bradyrhizobium sp. USDA 4454]
MNGSIAETRRSSQTLDGFPASRDVICGFFAATVLVWVGFLCKQATVVESKPSSLPPGRHKYGRPVNAPVMKRQPESR